MITTVRGTPVFVEVRGEGRPVVNLHGWPAEHGQMLQMMEPLFERRRGWRRVYLDLPGMGRTPGTDAVRTHDQVLDLVAGVVEAVAADQGAVLVGHSYGSRLVRGLLQRWPERFGGALLLSPGEADPERETGEPVVLREDPGFAAAVDREKPFVHMVVVRTLPVLEIVRVQALPGALGADAGFLARIDQGPDFSYLDEPVRPFAAPVLVCTGRQDPAGWRRTSAWLEHFPRGTLAVLDRAGHLLFAEQPVLFRQLADEWLDRVEEHAAGR